MVSSAPIRVNAHLSPQSRGMAACRVGIYKDGSFLQDEPRTMVDVFAHRVSSVRYLTMAMAGRSDEERAALSQSHEGKGTKQFSV